RKLPKRASARPRTNGRWLGAPAGSGQTTKDRKRQKPAVKKPTRAGRLSRDSTARITHPPPEKKPPRMTGLFLLVDEMEEAGGMICRRPHYQSLPLSIQSPNPLSSTR